MPPNPIKGFSDIPGLNVSRETLELFQHYQSILERWQQTINLVSPATLPDAMVRHFADSAQLVPLIPPGVKSVADLGSGAGFPGLVIKLLRPDLYICLIESDSRKCSFLRNVARELNMDIVVDNSRIEEMINEISGTITTYDSIPDLVTARALSPLPELLGYCLPWAEKKPELKMLFLKGRRVAEEIVQAQEAYRFDIRQTPSITDPDGTILLIENLQRR